MKLRPQIDSPNLAYSFGGVILAGAVASSLLTTDPRWMNWHFSRLGEGGTIASMVFNATLLISAIFMFALGMTLRNNISNIADTPGINTNRARTIISRAFGAVAICLIGVAIFPFDRFPVIHNIFGYSMLFIFLALCVAMPKVLPIFSRQFHNYSRLVILCAVMSYTLFIAAKFITLLNVELVIFIFLYVWLLLFIDGIRKSYSNE